MKGVIFNLLEKYVEDKFGEFSFQELLDENQKLSSKRFISPQIYPDEDFLALFIDVTKKFNIDVAQLQVDFGRFCFPILKSKVPDITSKINNFRDFAFAIDSVIHVEVAKLFPGAITPRIICKDLADRKFSIEYVSDRNLCLFMEGLLKTAAEDFKENITIKQTRCKLNEKCPSCTFQIEMH